MGDVPSLLDFYETYKTEDACWNQLREARWGENGFTCPACGEDEHWGFIQTRKLFQCHECGKQTSVTAGTILQDTELDLTTWFLAAYVLVVTKKVVSTPDLAMKVGVSEKTAWFLSHKILEVLGKAPAGKLFGIVEADETFLEGKRPGKGGRAKNEQMVMGVVERGGGRIRPPTTPPHSPRLPRSTAWLHRADGARRQHDPNGWVAALPGDDPARA